MNEAGVYVLDNQYLKQINHFRSNNLLMADGFIASTEAIVWSESDEKGVVLAVINEQGEILSSMRAEILSDTFELSQKLDFDDLDKYITFPCGLLGKASTHPDYRESGLNTYLRYLCYQYFHDNQIQFVAGTMIPHAPRVKLLIELGYEFISNPSGWRRYGYHSQGNTLVGYLDLKNNFEHVMRILLPKIQTHLVKYPLMSKVIQNHIF